MLVTGIPRTRRDSTAPRIGRMERTSRSRFRRACRTWHVGGGARREIGMILPDGRKRVIVFWSGVVTVVDVRYAY